MPSVQTTASQSSCDVALSRDDCATAQSAATVVLLGDSQLPLNPITSAHEDEVADQKQEPPGRRALAAPEQEPGVANSVAQTPAMYVRAATTLRRRSAGTRARSS